MPLHVDELVSEVVPEAENSPAVPLAAPDWAERFRQAQRAASLAEDRRRVAAEDFDD